MQINSLPAGAAVSVARLGGFPPNTPISRSRHFEIESQAPVGRNPEVTVNHQPGPAATGI